MSAIIENKIWLALRKHISDKVQLPIIWPLDTFDLDVTKYQAIVNYVPNASTRPSLGNDETHYYDGLLVLTLMSPINRSLEQITQQAATLVDAFPESARLEFDGVRVHIAKRGDITQTYRDAGMWRTPINIRWRQFGG